MKHFMEKEAKTNLERIGDGIKFPPACFLCPARTYTEGGYYCDTGKLDQPDSRLNVAHYRPDRCPNKPEATGNSFSVQVLLRKTLER